LIKYRASGSVRRGLMDNNLVLERISNLKGRLGYEEKKAKKLGFASLYDYMEDKINNENKDVISAIEVQSKVVKAIKKKKKPVIKTCGCC
jgi:hypothetical protein|tara:strand:- start:380 stop:649 length:270 start_codon:yes stop_codon:yes gene_type:complete